MEEFRCLSIQNDGRFCGTPKIEVLTKLDNLPIPDRYFDNLSLQTAPPSYIWKSRTNEIVAFVLNTEVSFPDIGYGVKIVGYQSISKDISFTRDILSSDVKHIKTYNRENGYPYDYIIFNDESFVNNKLCREKIESYGFKYDDKARGFYLSIKEENAS